MIDLIEMKAWYFEGESGDKMTKTEVPEEYLKVARVRRETLLEKLADEDDDLMHKLLEEENISV